MRTIFIAAASFVLGAATAAAIATEVAQPDAVTTPLARTTTTATAQPTMVLAKPEVIVALTTIPANGATHVHKHPYQRFVYVLSGNLRVANMTTGGHNDYKPGTFVAEMRDTYHFGAPADGHEVKLLVIDLVPPGT